MGCLRHLGIAASNSSRLVLFSNKLVSRLIAYMLWFCALWYQGFTLARRSFGPALLSDIWGHRLSVAMARGSKVTLVRKAKVGSWRASQRIGVLQKDPTSRERRVIGPCRRARETKANLLLCWREKENSWERRARAILMRFRKLLRQLNLDWILFPFLGMFGWLLSSNVKQLF